VGIAFSATSPFWISDNHAGVSTLYDGNGTAQSLVVTVPTAAGGTPPGRQRESFSMARPISAGLDSFLPQKMAPSRAGQMARPRS